MDSCKPVSNKDLTPQERQAKRRLKKQLKLQQKRIRLETKLRHAMTRHDARVEQETRLELEKFDEKHSLQQQECTDSIAPLEETPERTFVLQVCSELQRRQSGTKQVQTEQAVALLRNMTKATQTKTMFQDSDALWGYTRQKFFERAMLVCTSFLKLKPKQENENESELKRGVWDKLCLTKRICSIGCGPGNDAVGVAAFLKATKTTTGIPLERVVLLDWAMEEWNLVVEPLRDIVVPDVIQELKTSSCDISESLLDSNGNKQAKELLLNNNKSTTNIDVFLISYLLTEVRGQWHDFVTETIHTSQPGTLFYFAEPTPWQLHRVRAMFSHELDFIWLDSSMNHPELQPLDNRLGPGVLLGRKRIIQDDNHR